MRRKSWALACASVAAGLLLGPLPAAHAAVAPVLYGAGSGENPAGGLVTVSATSDSAITSITAHLYAPDSAPDAPEVAQVTDFTRTSGTDQQGLWQSTTPLRMAELGTYRIVVDLTDADGDTSSTEGRYGYAYVLRANLTDYQVAPQSPDYDHQDVAVSGRYTVTDPRTGETTPADGEADVATSNTGEHRRVPLDADGRFSLSYTQTREYGGTVSPWLYLADPAPLSQGNNADNVDVTPVKSDTRVTLDATEVSVKAGQAATVSGTAEVYAGGAWKPLAGAIVDEVWSSDMGGAASRPVTGADGRFTGQLTLSRSGTVEVQVRSGTFLNTSPLRTVKVYVARKTSITDFTATLNKYSQLTAKGLLHTGTSIPGDADNKVDLQYSADGKTGWTTMKTVTPGTSEPETGATFKGTFAAPSKGYYRARFKATRDWQASYSPVVYVKRTPTRIIDGNASPEPVRKGRTLTYKGKLQHYTSGAWKAYADQKVKILFRPKGSSTWYDMGNTYTRTDGTFSKGFTASKDGTWVAVLLYPTSTHLVSSGREDYVDVI